MARFLINYRMNKFTFTSFLKTKKLKYWEYWGKDKFEVTENKVVTVLFKLNRVRPKVTETGENYVMEIFIMCAVWNRDQIEELMVSHSPAFYGAWRFIAMFMFATRRHREED
jgi:hypothetical protein